MPALVYQGAGGYTPPKTAMDYIKEDVGVMMPSPLEMTEAVSRVTQLVEMGESPDQGLTQPEPISTGLHIQYDEFRTRARAHDQEYLEASHANEKVNLARLNELNQLKEAVQNERTATAKLLELQDTFLYCVMNSERLRRQLESGAVTSREDHRHKFGDIAEANRIGDAFGVTLVERLATVDDHISMYGGAKALLHREDARLVQELSKSDDALHDKTPQLWLDAENAKQKYEGVRTELQKMIEPFQREAEQKMHEHPDFVAAMADDPKTAQRLLAEWQADDEKGFYQIVKGTAGVIMDPTAKATFDALLVRYEMNLENHKAQQARFNAHSMEIADRETRRRAIAEEVAGLTGQLTDCGNELAALEQEYARYAQEDATNLTWQAELSARVTTIEEWLAAFKPIVCHPGLVSALSMAAHQGMLKIEEYPAPLNKPTATQTTQQ